MIHIHNYHTDALRDFYGEITCDLIVQTDEHRIVLLKDRSHIIRTIAITEFHHEINEALQELIELIKTGVIIADAVKAKHLTLRKEIFCYFEIQTPKIMNDFGQYTVGRFSKVYVNNQIASNPLGLMVEIFCPTFQVDKESSHSDHNNLLHLNKILAVSEFTEKLMIKKMFT